MEVGNLPVNVRVLRRWVEVVVYGHGQSVQVRSAVGGREVLGLGALQGELPNQATQAYQYHAESHKEVHACK